MTAASGYTGLLNCSTTLLRPRPRNHKLIEVTIPLREVQSENCSHSVDALACPCGGRLKFVDVITEPTTAREILQSMGLPTDLPPIAKARSPDFYQDSFPSDWD